ncbi:hypothetical protein Scep_019025 [Stephania cephalantha]|uniref:Uncharacterized protein n=1 Tax=Stephania cephalantha TaxID=152367 RepID=A0AAP0NPF1_9MAGN
MATSKKITVKLLVDRKANKVLFAEAGKDFVDFLICLLSLPLASVLRAWTKWLVAPLSTISSIMVLKKFNIENFTFVDEIAVDIGMDEGLKLLRAPPAVEDSSL